MLGITYPFDKLHDDRVDGTFNVVVMIGCEGPVIWVVFDLGFCLGSHDGNLDIEANSPSNSKTEYLWRLWMVKRNACLFVRRP